VKLELHISSKVFQIDSDQPIDISIPLNFNGEQPNTYNVPKASAKAYENGVFIGDTRRGGSCNFEVYKLIPHCNGTHTECVGHISYQRISIESVLKDSFVPATLITVQPEKGVSTNDSYMPPKAKDDLLITKSSISAKLERHPSEFLDALIIRTLPNDPSKKARKYMSDPPPYFSLEAMEYIAKLRVKHLLVDVPSLDRAFDEGKLSNHHIFWNIPQGSHDVDEKNHSVKTITEMIFVPAEIADGRYILNIQVPAFVADAAPSRIIMYKAIQKRALE
jgi:kynurenine formamidase